MSGEMDQKLLGGRYRIDALIGRGGMSDVYRGQDVMLQRQVAIKILTDRSDDLRKRFLREAQSMARLNHPNIVGVYDAAQNDGVSYIVMELVQGRTLASISPSELTVHTALRYILELLEALAFAHENNVVHRDVKPANIMVLNNGAIKVMDFGLSRRTSEMSSVTNAGEIVGTIAYLSPERFLGKIADARSDLYSVGVVMYRSLHRHRAVQERVRRSRGRDLRARQRTAGRAAHDQPCRSGTDRTHRVALARKRSRPPLCIGARSDHRYPHAAGAQRAGRCTAVVGRRHGSRIPGPAPESIDRQ